MSLVEVVERQRRDVRRLALATACASGVGVTCGLLLTGAVLLGNARWMTLPRGVPLMIWLAVAVGDATVIVGAHYWLTRRGSRATIAAAIEREQHLRAGAVRGALEVADEGVLGRAAAERVSARLRASQSPLIPDAVNLLSRRLRSSAVVAIVAVGGLGAAAPRFGDGLAAVLRPDKAWTGSLLPPLALRNVPAILMLGERVRLVIDARGRTALTMRERTAGETWRTEDIPVSEGGVASWTIGPMRGDLHLIISDGRSADSAFIRATDRPFLGVVAMRATYPAYLGRPAEGLPVGEPARVPYGTIIDVSGRTSTALRSVRLTNGADSIAIGISGLAFAGRLEAKRGGSWRWVAVSNAGRTVPDIPLPLELEVVPDSIPSVRITSPASDTTVAPTDRLAVAFTATDDHALTRLALESWRVGAGGVRGPSLTRELPVPSGTVWNGVADIDLAPRGLDPGDALHVVVEAFDNAPWGQHGESRELVMEVPTVDQVREHARAMGDSAVTAARAMARAEQALQDRTDEMARDRGTRNPTADAMGASSTSSATAASSELSFESAQKAKALAQDQRSLTDDVKRLQGGAKALEDQLREAGALDSSLAHQLQEAQALLQNALTPDLLAQMKSLEEAAKQLSRDDAEVSLKDLEAMQQRLREQLEKTAEILRRAALEGSMQTLGDQAKDLAAQDRQLADSIAGSTRPATRRIDAGQLAARTDRLDQAIKKLQGQLDGEKTNAGATPAGEAERLALASAEELRSAAKDSANAAAGDSSRTPAHGGPMEQDVRLASGNMERAAQSLREARNAQVQSWKSELSSTLDQSVQELLQMARQEASLEDKTRSGQGEQEDLRGDQSAIKQGLDDVAKRLQAAGQQSALVSNRSQRAIGDAEQKTEQAVKLSAATAPTPGQTASVMGDAVESMNRAAVALARDRERVNTASSASGFAEMMRELQEVASKQGTINSAAQNFLTMPGSQVTSAAQAMARELARQQRELAQELDDLGDNPGGDRTAQLAEQAKQIADALDNGQLNAETISRQQQLLHKMLDAGRSLQQDDREDGEHREATAATGSAHFVPGSSSVSGKAAAQFPVPTWDELRGLTPDERRAILEYFQRINGHGP